MIKQRYCVLFLAICSMPLRAELTRPDCDQLQQWASTYDAGDQWQVTDRLRLPGIARDDVLVPLFGEPVTNWSSDDFNALNQWVMACRQQTPDRVAGQALVTASRAMLRVTGYVQQMQQVREQSRQAVEAIRAEPASEGKTAAVDLAGKALRGDNIRRELRNVPREFHRPLSQLSNATGYLPRQDLGELLNRLSGGETVTRTSSAGMQPETAPEGERTAQVRAEPRRPVEPAPQRKAAPAITSTPKQATASDAPQAPDLDLPPPSLTGGSAVTGMRMVGIHLGMPLEAAIEAGKKAGYRIKSQRGNTFKMGVFEYWLDSAELEKGEIEPFPEGKMTREESLAYQTRLAIQAVQSRSISLTAYEGRVGKVSVSASTFESPDEVKAYVVGRLGEPHKESGAENLLWDMNWYQAQDKRTFDDTQLRVSVKQIHYTDMVRGANVPYTQINYSAWLCNTLPKCMER